MGGRTVEREFDPDLLHIAEDRRQMHLQPVKELRELAFLRLDSPKLHPIANLSLRRLGGQSDRRVLVPVWQLGDL